MPTLANTSLHLTEEDPKFLIAVVPAGPKEPLVIVYVGVPTGKLKLIESPLATTPMFKAAEEAPRKEFPINDPEKLEAFKIDVDGL